MRRFRPFLAGVLVTPAVAFACPGQELFEPRFWLSTVVYLGAVALPFVVTGGAGPFAVIEPMPATKHD